MSVHNRIIPSVAKGVFPSPIIRIMPLKSNLKELASYKACAPKENRGTIEHLFELCFNKKIFNFRSSDKACLTHESKPTQAKALKEYDKIAGK